MKRHIALMVSGLLTGLILTAVLTIGAREGLFAGASKDTQAAEPPAPAVQDVQPAPEIVVTIEAPTVAPAPNTVASTQEVMVLRAQLNQSAQEIMALRTQLNQVYREMQQRDAAYRAQLEQAYNLLQQSYVQVDSQPVQTSLVGGNGNRQREHEAREHHEDKAKEARDHEDDDD